jgi:hypothetical protein
MLYLWTDCSRASGLVADCAICTRFPVPEKEPRSACGETVCKMYCLIGRIPVLCHVSASLRQTSLSQTPHHALNSTHPTQGRYIQRRLGRRPIRHGAHPTRLMDNPSTAQHLRKVRKVIDYLAHGVNRFGGLETSSVAFVIRLWQT